MITSKGLSCKHKKLNILHRGLVLAVAVVLIVTCGASPFYSSADYSYNLIPKNCTVKADYVIESDLDYGSNTLTYSSLGSVGGMSFYRFSNAPFNYGAPVGSSTVSYSTSVEIKGLNVSLPVSENDYYCRFRCAIGTASQILGMPDKTSVYLTDNVGTVIQELRAGISGNVLYVEDTFQVPSSNAIGIKIVFQFGELYNSSMPYSNSTYFWCTMIAFGRASDMGDVETAIGNASNNIINADGDGSIGSTNSDMSDKNTDLDSIEDEIKNLPLPEVSKPDVTEGVADLSLSFLYFATAFDSLILSLGVHFDTLWWILISLGLVAAVFGIAISVFNRLKG